MRNIWLAVFAGVVLFLAQPALSDNAPAQNSAAQICHQCEWIKIQIGDIDEKIASWERQIRSITKNSNLADPNIQNALKDIDSKIAALKAKKADLQAKLADCQKRCAQAMQSEPKPVTPDGHVQGGGGQGGAGQGGIGTDSAASSDIRPKPAVQCPAERGPAVSLPDSSGGAGTSTNGSPTPGPNRVPPASKNPNAEDNWNHLLNHMDDAEGPDGDEEDVWEVAADINVAIQDAWDDIYANPFDASALGRLEWLEDQRAYYEDWKAYIRYYSDVFLGKPELIPDCQPKHFHLWITPRREEKSDSGLGNFLGNVTIGVDVGGGHHDDKKNDSGWTPKLDH